ncbi:MAG: insulinase family protein [Candidatus Aminicenantes bacterium]|nr:insulinase family protein [Candidatus Aminicenantes bacterium]
MKKLFFLSKGAKCALGAVFLLIAFFSFSFSQEMESRQANNAVKISLENGLPLILAEDDSSALTVLQILIKGGKRAEPSGKEGLAYLTTYLTLEITDMRQLQDLMSQASHISMFCFEDYSLVIIICLTEHLDSTLEIMFQTFKDPLLSGMRINRVKDNMNFRRKFEEDDSVKVGHQKALDGFFGQSAYAGSVLGTEDSLKNIKKKDIENYYHNYFHAGGMIVSAVSNMKSPELTEVLKKHFSSFPRQDVPPPASIQAGTPDNKTISQTKDTQLTFVSLAYPLPRISKRSYALALLLENYLGRGIGSMLWPLRSEKNLAYNVNAFSTQLQEGGFFEAYLETEPPKKEEALKELKAVLEGVFANGMTEEDLAVAKINSRFHFLRDNETKENRAHYLAEFEALGLGFNFLEKLLSEIEAVTVDEMNTYLKQILDPEKGIKITIGPDADLPAER